MSDSIQVQGRCDARFARVREIFQQSFDDDTELGAAVSFVLDGDCVVDLWGGWSDRARTRPWRKDTLVNVFSTTKGMAALCVHQLVERGLVAIDAPVCRYWPEFAAAGKGDITMRQLLSHQAGLCAVREPLPKDSLYDWDRVCTALAAQEPWWTPGAAHGYHAFTFGFLVGEVVRRVSGMSIGRWFRQHVAEPLRADFHIGFGAGLDARVAQIVSTWGEKRATPPPENFAEFARLVQVPESMQFKALLNPPMDRDAVNTRAWRAAEIPAVNGHGTATSLARIYGALARAGEIDGVRIVQPETIANAVVEQVSGPELLFCGAVPMRFGLGFVLSDDGHRYSRLCPHRRGFGHAGGGGSLGMSDPDIRLGFGFTMNRTQASMVSAGATPTRLMDAFYDAL